MQNAVKHSEKHSTLPFFHNNALEQNVKTVYFKVSANDTQNKNVRFK